MRYGIKTLIREQMEWKSVVPMIIDDRGNVLKNCNLTG